MKPVKHVNKYIIRKPGLNDGKSIYRLASTSKPLDLNSLYSYFLICTHFDQTSAVTIIDDELIGYVSAYLHPRHKNTLFIWQVAVNPKYRGKGLATNMLNHIIKRTDLNIKYLEATVTPSNNKSQQLFKKFAEQLEANYDEEEFLGNDLFSEYNHEKENLIKIGPIKNTE